MQSEVNIWSLVKSLLHTNNCVIVPNLGGFLGHQQSATIDPLSMWITPPCKYITFNAQLTLNDGLLASKIADYLKISYSDAIKIIDEEVSNFHQTLKNNSQFIIEGLGHFELNESQNLVFSPDKKANFLINSFGLEPVRANNIVNSKTTKIIQKNDLITNVSVVETAELNLTEDGVEANRNAVHPELRSGKKRRNSLVFSLIGSVLFLVLGLNAYIFLQEGNLTPIRNKFDELNLGIKIKSAINQFSNSTNVAIVIEVPKTIKKVETILDSTKLNNDTLYNTSTSDIISKGNIISNYYIVAGAFKSKRKANKLLKALNNEGFANAEIIEKPKASAKKIKFYVTYSKFSSLNETTLELSKINESENPEAWIFEAK